MLSTLLALPALGLAATSAVDPRVLSALQRQPSAPIYVVMRAQPDVSNMRSVVHGDARVAAVVSTLRDHAQADQAELRQELDRRGLRYRSFWAVNALSLQADSATLQWLANRPEVAEIAWDGPTRRVPQVVAELPTDSTRAVEQGVEHIGAHLVWAAGFRGEGVLIAGQDTGYEWTHPALQAAYAGWDGQSADHNYHWWDAIHSGGGVCGPDSATPCDDNDHGTHTMGTMLGDDGGNNQIGVAPAARWIGCRNMDQGDGTPTTYSECFQFYLAPTDSTGNNPDPARAPHVINNSWGCPTSEGCTDPDVMRTLVENVRAAGILVVVSAGNSGSGCSSVNTPAAIYEASFTVGNSTFSDTMATSSSRGPVTVDGSNRIKPDVTAPGTGIRSSVRGGGYLSFTGTSMSGPHVAGAAALLMSADETLKRDPDRVIDLLQQTAVSINSTQTCGGIPTTTIPNPVFGHGRIDVAAAYALLTQGTMFDDGFEDAAPTADH
ncbi:MAG: S8 family serine peptidase [Xanthomonadales bacterium]|nr:S8 family serine peptidase [Xanthomonadales bacterium]